MLFVDGGNDKVMIGLETPDVFNGTTPPLQIEGTDNNKASLSITRNSNDNGQPLLILSKSRGTSVNSDTILQDNDVVGEIVWLGADGNDRNSQVATIQATVDGTPGSNDMPGALSFRTTADGAATATERMRIDSSGNISIGGSIIDSSRLSVTSSGTDGRILALQSSGTGATDAILIKNDNGEVGTVRTSGSSTAYNTSSDYRLKENVNYSWDATTRLKQLKPARFNFKADADLTLDGFLAHEVSSIVPEAISGTKDETQDLGIVKNKDGDVIYEDVLEIHTKKDEGQTWTKTKTEDVYQGIDQSKLVPLLVKTIQELEARVTGLEEA
jgi:hypothetical protein